jgi:hypothetical protein
MTATIVAGATQGLSALASPQGEAEAAMRAFGLMGAWSTNCAGWWLPEVIIMRFATNSWGLPVLQIDRPTRMIMTLEIASASLGPNAQISIITTGVPGIPAQQIVFRRTEVGLMLWRSESLPRQAVVVDEGRASLTGAELAPMNLCQSE